MARDMSLKDIAMRIYKIKDTNYSEFSSIWFIEPVVGRG
jgi:hypothetical protein